MAARSRAGTIAFEAIGGGVVTSLEARDIGSSGVVSRGCLAAPVGSDAKRFSPLQPHYS
jgi:hypothetical protein